MTSRPDQRLRLSYLFLYDLPPPSTIDGQQLKLKVPFKLTSVIVVSNMRRSQRTPHAYRRRDRVHSSPVGPSILKSHLVLSNIFEPQIRTL